MPSVRRRELGVPGIAHQNPIPQAHVRTILEQAGAGPEAIAKMTVYLQDDDHRKHVNDEWLKMFPDEHDRPARHTMRADLRRGMLVQCDVIAVLSG